MPPHYRTRSTTAATGTSSSHYETRSTKGAGTSSAQTEGLNDLLKCRRATTQEEEPEPVVLVPGAKPNPWNAFEMLNKGKKDVKVMWNDMSGEKKNMYRKKKCGVKATVRCRSERFIDHVESLEPERLKMLEGSPFHRLLEMKRGIQCNARIKQLLSMFNTETSCFEIEGAEYAVTAVDFSQIMGVEDGEEIIGMNEKASDHLKRVFSKGKANIDMKEVMKQLKTSVDDDNVKRAYALLALHFIICAPYSGHLPNSSLAFVQDVTALNRKKWATYAIECLVEGIKRFKKSKGDKEIYIPGCTIFLQLYAERMIPEDKLPWYCSSPKTKESKLLEKKEDVLGQLQEVKVMLQKLRKKNVRRYKKNSERTHNRDAVLSELENHIKVMEADFMIAAYEERGGGV